MSIYLKDYIDRFLAKKISADEFAESYISKWKCERDGNLLQEDEGNLSELLSSTFCLSDMYNSDDDREEYEFNEDQLRDEINKIMLAYLTK
ncbi:colicin immunity domain-containing protein [Erwinia sp.]|uniref:colicin immunity domain-containing protein n=1 Tax=Erwinia citreus TaxID=558 RepID=UPI00289D6A9B|nr:colicin immunity domain-containing protein [Erwinia sp.]